VADSRTIATLPAVMVRLAARPDRFQHCRFGGVAGHAGRVRLVLTGRTLPSLALAASGVWTDLAIKVPHYPILAIDIVRQWRMPLPRGCRHDR